MDLNLFLVFFKNYSAVTIFPYHLYFWQNVINIGAKYMSYHIPFILHVCASCYTAMLYTMYRNWCSLQVQCIRRRSEEMSIVWWNTRNSHIPFTGPFMNLNIVIRTTTCTYTSTSTHRIENEFAPDIAIPRICSGSLVACGWAQTITYIIVKPTLITVSALEYCAETIGENPLARNSSLSV